MKLKIEVPCTGNNGKVKAMTPPGPTPEVKVLTRVLLISAIDGWSVVALSVLGTLLALVLGDLSSVVVSLLIGATGVLELRGRQQLVRRNPGGMRLLVRAQMLLLLVILVYCVSRLASFDEGTVLGNLTPEMEAVLKENGLERGDILPAVQMMFYIGYGAVAFVSILFQGGLTLYYRSRTASVSAALAPRPEPTNYSVL
jgi:hypothetical protein